MTKVYFAGPLFNKAEKDYNLKVVSVLEKAGYKVFLPQRDGGGRLSFKGHKRKRKD
jgi:nucleoside 2-deoxyribosyltransferase